MKLEHPAPQYRSVAPTVRFSAESLIDGLEPTPEVLYCRTATKRYRVMGHSLLDSAGSYDDGTVKVLCDAFDQAWQEIGCITSRMSIEEKRTRLALIILELGNQGGRDVEEIRDTAVEFMRYLERLPNVRFRTNIRSQ